MADHIAKNTERLDVHGTEQIITLELMFNLFNISIANTHGLPGFVERSSVVSFGVRSMAAPHGPGALCSTGQLDNDLFWKHPPK